MSGPAMTEDEMVRAVMRQVAGISRPRAVELVRARLDVERTYAKGVDPDYGNAERCLADAFAARTKREALAESRPPVLARAGSGLTQAEDVHVYPGVVDKYKQLIVLDQAGYDAAIDGETVVITGSGVLTYFSRTKQGACRLVLEIAPRTKKNSTMLGIRQSPAYRRYRDEIIAALSPIVFAFGNPLLVHGFKYNCAATFYVDKKGEQADFNGLNQGLHDALENAGVVSDDWFFRTCDGTRIVFGDELPRVDVLITPLSQGT